MKIDIKVKHHLYSLSLRNSDPGVKAQYTCYENLRTCIKNLASLCYGELFDNTKTSAYNLWKRLGSIINNIKKKCSNLMNKIINEGITFSGAKSIVNTLKSYFCEIGQVLQSKFPNTAKSFTIFQKICSYNPSLPMT